MSCCRLSAKKERIGLLACLLVVFFSLGFAPPSVTESDDARTPISGHQLHLLLEGAPPEFNGGSALIMDMATGKVVFALNAHVRIAPASTTKIMTAIVALEKGDLARKITIKKDHLQEGSFMGLSPGDVLTLEDLLWGLLLPSGNDAAMAIADGVGGSVDAFVQMMNQKATELGLKDTHFVNPHGLDEDDQYSSAYDLAVTSCYAMRNPLFAKMVGTRVYTVNASRVFLLENANQLLHPVRGVPGVDGIKTGYTEKAGDSLVSSVTRQGRRVIVVAMGTPSRDQASIPLIEYAFRAFTWVPLQPPYVTPKQDSSASVSIVARRDEMLALWQVPYVSITVNNRVSDANLPQARYWLGNNLLAELPFPLAP